MYGEGVRVTGGGGTQLKEQISRLKDRKIGVLSLVRECEDKKECK